MKKLKSSLKKSYIYHTYQLLFLPLILIQPLFFSSLTFSIPKPILPHSLSPSHHQPRRQHRPSPHSPPIWPRRGCLRHVWLTFDLPPPPPSPPSSALRTSPPKPPLSASFRSCPRKPMPFQFLLLLAASKSLELSLSLSHVCCGSMTQRPVNGYFYFCWEWVCLFCCGWFVGSKFEIQRGSKLVYDGTAKYLCGVIYLFIFNIFWRIAHVGFVL